MRYPYYYYYSDGVTTAAFHLAGFSVSKSLSLHNVDTQCLNLPLDIQPDDLLSVWPTHSWYVRWYTLHGYAYALIAKCHNTIKQLIAMAVHVP